MAPKRARTAGEDGDSNGGAEAVADGFEAPLFGARVVGQVTTLLPLEGDGPTAASDMYGVVSDHADAWYVTTENAVLHVSAAGRVRRVATLEGVTQRAHSFAFEMLSRHSLAKAEQPNGGTPMHSMLLWTQTRADVFVYANELFLKASVCEISRRGKVPEKRL